jgi:prepilin-type N-terminal cleavage/methylation domain-containing protein
VKRRSESGFTLLELLIAMTVALIGLAGMMSIFVTLARSNSVNRQQGDAVAISQRVAEDLRSLSIDELAATYGGGALPIDQVAMPAVSERSIIYTPVLSVTPNADDPDLLLVRVEVQWQEAGDPSAEARHRIGLEVLRTRLERL